MDVTGAILFRVVVFGVATLLTSIGASTAQTGVPTMPQPGADFPAQLARAEQAVAPAPPGPTPPPPEDLVVSMRYVSGNTTTTSTLSIKGPHRRIDYGPDLAVLQQCGSERIIQVNDQNKRFLTAEDSSSADAAGGAKAPKKGGTVTYTSTTTDTGERKEIHGVMASHLKTVVVKTKTPDACDKRVERVETDGWFIDPPVKLCPAAPRATAMTTAEGCRDNVEYVDSPGSTASAHYPLAYTMTTTGGDAKTTTSTTMTMEVTSMAKRTLSESLFAVPEGYVEVPNLIQLSALPDGRKRPGVLRTCALRVTGKSEAGVRFDELSDALVVSLGDAGVDAVHLDARTAADERGEAQLRECDYLLSTEITDIRQPNKGLLGRVSGTTQGYGARVDFKMFAPGSGSPQLFSSERSGASTLKTALGAAKVASRYVTPLGLLSSNFGSMGVFTSLAGGTPSPAMQQSSDPVINTVFTLVDKATGNKPEGDLLTAESAIAAALEQEVGVIVAFLSKKPK